MKNFTIPLLFLGFGLSSVFGGTAVLTFDTDLQGFAAGENAGALPPVWSNFDGGSMELNFAGGWNYRVATLNLAASTTLFPVFQEVLTKGGTLSYDMTVRTNDIIFTTPGTFPDWWEPMIIGDSTGVEDRPFGGNDNVTAYYGAGAFPAGAVRKTTITLPIEAAGSAVADDGKLQINPGSTTFRISMGLNTDGNRVTSSKYFIDNFRVTSNAVAVVVPPPTTALEPSVAGMNLYSSGTGQYDRQTLRTATPQYSWIGQATPANPITYSLTISNYSSKPGMGTVFYLVPGTLPVSMNFPDYGMSKCIAGYLYNNADRTGNFRLAYKNDVPNTNGADPNSLYGGGSPNDLWPANPAWVEGDNRKPGTGIGGTLANVNGTSILGTWSITFTSNTSVTITSPSGQTSTGSLPNEQTAQLWADPMYAYFGTVPGEPARIGERVIFSNITVSGGANAILGDIDANLSSGLLQKSASNDPGIVFINPSDQPYWFTWTLPATDYVVQQSPSLGREAAWSDLSTTNSIAQPGGRRLLLNTIDLASPTRNYLRMSKPPLP